MSTVFTVARRSLLALFIVCFTFTAVYVPQVHINKVESVYAGTVIDPWNLIQNTWTRIQTTLGTAYQYVTSTLANNTWIKEFLLDKLAWNIAKNAISMMTRSIVRWINSGFQGSPAFIQDLGGFLTNVADETIGQFISELGNGELSIICSPFRLDVQVAVATAYNRTRDKNARRCTLSGALQNIQNFIGGDMNQGGWDAWLRIVQNPHMYTPYGSAIEASVEANIRIVNAQGQQSTILNWGSGFLSNVFCNNSSQGAQPGSVATPARDCPITTPGRVIADQLNHTLGLGADSLVAADEINEIIGALLGQLVTQVITGANGLLGSSGGTRYSNPSFNVDLFTPGMELETVGADAATTRAIIIESIEREVAYAQLAQSVITRYESSYVVDPRMQGIADGAYNEARSVLPTAQANAMELQDILTAFDTAQGEEARQKTLSEYLLLSGRLANDATISGARQNWDFALSGMAPRDDNFVDRVTFTVAIDREQEFRALAEDAIAVYNTTPNPTPAQQNTYAEVLQVLPTIQSNIIALQNLLLEYDQADDTTFGDIIFGERNEVIAKYNALRDTLYSEAEIEEARTRWETTLGPLGTP